MKRFVLPMLFTLGSLHSKGWSLQRYAKFHIEYQNGTRLHQYYDTEVDKTIKNLETALRGEGNYQIKVRGSSYDQAIESQIDEVKRLADHGSRRERERAKYELKKLIKKAGKVIVEINFKS